MVLRLIAEGLSNAEIADQLFVSATTVKTHVARILMQLDPQGRVQAVVLAHQIGLVGPHVGSAATGLPSVRSPLSAATAAHLNGLPPQGQVTCMRTSFPEPR